MYKKKKQIALAKDKYTVIDDFLPRHQFLDLKRAIMHADFPWHYEPNINEFERKDKSCYFTHMFYEGSHFIKSKHFDILLPLIDKINPRALLRIKCNLYPVTSKLLKHKAHIDYNFPHKAALFSINTCDGATILDDDTKIDSVENRLLLFDASKPHSSTSTTNQNARININWNYF